jgi:DNA uptake protein ComE-like DNA-binding protein
MKLSRIVVLLAFAGVYKATATAQTPVVPYNHLPAGNFTFRLLDLNTVSSSELLALPSVSKALALKIVKGRPYRTAHDLVDRRILSAAAFAKIENRVGVWTAAR